MPAGEDERNFERVSGRRLRLGGSSASWLLAFSRSAIWRVAMTGRCACACGCWPSAIRVVYPTLHELLRQEGLVINPKRRRELQRPRAPMLVPVRANQRWSMVFVSGKHISGRRILVLHSCHRRNHPVLRQ